VCNSGAKLDASCVCANADPVWSPDAKKIAFNSMKSGDWRIYQLDLATGAETQLPDVRGGGDYMTPAYHPDGQTLAFSVTGNARS